MSRILRTAVVGGGLIGRRRALAAGADPRSRCVAVADVNEAAARDLAAALGSGVAAYRDWREVVGRSDVDAVVVATPNGFLAEVTVAALEAGKHVLVEKPMGRNVEEAEQMRTAGRSAGRQLKVGFNHRYHPAIAEAKRRVDAGEIGPVVNLRCRYGHGGRPGLEREWRASREQAGGGELIDQGVHVVDLIHWFVGVPAWAFAYLQTAVWPLGDLEDNAFCLLRWRSGVTASLHASMTQWKNLFSLEVFGRDGAVAVEGLGRSYGPETLAVYWRRPEGGVPLSASTAYEGEDPSWRLEWEDFLGAVLEGRPMLGGADDGVAAMRMLKALYASAASGVQERV